MIPLEEITEIIVSIQADVDRSYVELDAMQLYRAFYEQDKAINGSNKQYIGTPEYDKKQDARVDCCLNRLNYAYEEIKLYYISNGVDE